LAPLEILETFRNPVTINSPTPTTLSISLLTSVVAFLYTSIGHGGASGYLALLSFTNASPDEASTSALILSLLAAALSLFFYTRAGHFSFAISWPLILPSIPAAFIGGMLPISTQLYQLLLAGTLIFGSYRLLTAIPNHADNASLRSPSAAVAGIAGGAIGLISGIVGVGGGIFLSPLMILMRWANTKQTSATSAAFIVFNAMAALAGRFTRQAIHIGDLAPLIIAAIIGAVLGSYFGAYKFSGPTLRKVLAAVLLIATFKLVGVQLFPEKHNLPNMIFKNAPVPQSMAH
jgi:uncharacterized membrane protein YfcA